MSAPGRIQFGELRRQVSRLGVPIPIDVVQHGDGSIQVDAGDRYVIREADSCDALLDELVDVNDAADPDDRLNNLLMLLETHSS